MSAASAAVAQTLGRYRRDLEIDRFVVAGGIAALGVGLLLFWQFGLTHVVNIRYTSTPAEVGRSLLALVDSGVLLKHAQVTMSEAVSGYLIGIAVGLGGALLLLMTRRGYDVLEPYLMAFYSIPKIALAPLFIMWFGLGPTPKVLLATLMVFFIVFMNTVAGVRAVDRRLVDVVRVLGARRLQVIGAVLLPAAAPAIVAAIRVTFARAMVGAVLAEMIASTEGLGHMLVRSARQFDMSTMFAGIAVIALLVMSVNITVSAVERRLFPWASRPVHG